MPNILVLGAGGSAGINFCRAIGELKHGGLDNYIVGVDTNPTTLPLMYADAAHHLDRTQGMKAHDLNELIEKYEIEYVHAQPDPEVLWLSQYGGQLNADVLLPDYHTVLTCQDKELTAQALGHMAPFTYEVPPLDFKPKWLRLKQGSGAKGALKITNPQHGRDWVSYWNYEKGVHPGAWLYQEYLPGRNYSWTGVYRDGLLKASACKERLQLLGASSHPADISSTASVQEIVYRTDINALCELAVPKLSEFPQGVFMFDLRENKDGDPKITEVNVGRFGTTSLFWAEAGGNLPRMLFDPPEAVERDVCRLGARWLRSVDSEPVLV